ncbi:hypothetical protein Tco_1561706 [Tanacetum coccineum]
MLTSCHDKCLVKYKLFVHSKVRRYLFTTPTTAKSKSLDTTPVVAKTRFAIVTPLSIKYKDSSTSQSTSLLAQENSLSKYMRKKVKTSRKWQKWFERQQNFGWSPKSVTVKACDPDRTVDCLGHNLFSVGQFCDGDLEVAFRSKTCYVRNLGDDLLTRARESNLYTISILDTTSSSPVCLMFKATSTKSWLWH